MLVRHQLTPELALDMSRATLVILIDASTDDPPGAIAVRPLAAEEDGAAKAGCVDAGSVDSAFRGRRDSGDGAVDQGSRDRGGPGATSHHVGPGELLALARVLYRAAPRALVVSIGVTHMEVGEALSPAVAAALPTVANLVVDLVRRRGLPPAS